MSSSAALMLTIGIIAALFAIAFVASRFGKRGAEALQKKEALRVSVQPRFFLSTLFLGLIVLFGIYLLIIGRAYLPNGIHELAYVLSATLILIVLVLFVFLPLVLRIFSQGEVNIKSNIFSWNVGDLAGQIDLTESFSVKKGTFTRSAPLATSNIFLFMPVHYISYTLTQGDKTVTMYHGASVDAVEGLEQVKREGIYVHSYGKVVMQKILSFQK